MNGSHAIPWHAGYKSTELQTANGEYRRKTNLWIDRERNETINEKKKSGFSNVWRVGIAIYRSVSAICVSWVMRVFCCWIEILFSCLALNNSIQGKVIENRKKWDIIFGSKNGTKKWKCMRYWNLVSKYTFNIDLCFDNGNVVVLNPFNWIAPELFAIWPTQNGWIQIIFVFLLPLFSYLPALCQRRTRTN